MRYKRVQAAVRHSFRALEVTCPRPGEFHPHFHVLLVVPGAYLEPHSPLCAFRAMMITVSGAT